jgi:amidase
MRGRFPASVALAGTLAGLDAHAQKPAITPAPRFDVVEKTIFDLKNEMDSGRVTSRQLVEQYLARIQAYDQDGPRINAFIMLNPHALDAAAALDAERRAGRVRGPLHGIPIVVKDNYAIADMPTTGGSLALEGFATRPVLGRRRFPGSALPRH